MRVLPGDATYHAQADAEAAFWSDPLLTVEILEEGYVGRVKRFIDGSYTGDPNVSWLEDLIRRGPFANAAVLGSTEGLREVVWLERGGSRRLDVYDISDDVLAKTYSRLHVHRFGLRLPDWRARLFRADLNFVELPRNRYDVVWSSASLHHVTNLEYLFDEVSAALRPGGLFAVHDYVGEPGLRYTPSRLEAVNRVLAQVPAQFRWLERIDPPQEDSKSPFEAIRSDETLDLVRQRFDVVHLARTEALFPLFIALDLARIEREAPDVLELVFAAELQARNEMPTASMYGVFRKREVAPRR